MAFLVAFFIANILVFIYALFIAGAYQQTLKEQFPTVYEKAYRNFTDVMFHHRFLLNPWYLLFTKQDEHLSKVLRPLKIACAITLFTAVSFVLTLLFLMFYAEYI